MTDLPDSEDAGTLVAGSGLEVSERERLSDLQARAAEQGCVLRQCRTGFVLQRADGLLQHRMHVDDIVGILNGTERQREGTR